MKIARSQFGKDTLFRFRPGLQAFDQLKQVISSCAKSCHQKQFIGRTRGILSVISDIREERSYQKDMNGIDPQGRATVPTPYEFEGVIGSDQGTNAQQGQVDPSGCIGTLIPNIEKKGHNEGQVKER